MFSQSIRKFLQGIILVNGEREKRDQPFLALKKGRSI